MDYQRFINQLPTCFEDWGLVSVRPKSKLFQERLDQIQGMTTANIMQLLNCAVAYMAPNEVYCEIGTYQGSTLIGALANHPDRMAYAVDNFSEYDPLGENLDRLMENLTKWGIQDQVVFCNQDFETFFTDLGSLEFEEKIGVYFYDGAHDYRSQLMGLLRVRPFLADQSVIIIDDSNWDTVQQAISDFTSTHPPCQPLLHLPTPIARHFTFWNGLTLLSWDTQRVNEAQVPPPVRYPDVIQGIYSLQMMEQRQSPNQLWQEVRMLQAQGRFQDAEPLYRLLMLWKKRDPEILLGLGKLYYATGRYREAFETIVQALQLDTTRAESHFTLGLIGQATGNLSGAITAYGEALRLEPERADVFLNLVECYKHLGDWQSAIQTLREAVRKHPTGAGFYFDLILLLREQGEMAEAIATAETAMKTLPEEYTFRILYHLLLPLLYETASEITEYRQRFTTGLQRLIQETKLDTAEARQSALAGTGRLTNFYLTYQFQNNRSLQSQYGQLLHQIMAANYPQWAKTPPMPALENNGKIRVGYASAYLHSYSGTLWLTGWLKYADRQSFELYCYYTGNQPDPITDQFREFCDVFHQIPGNLEAACQQIRADQLHILVFPEIGMDPPTLQMAALKLAPIVCTAWGHPDTSGLPTVDYYLSSELMEPEQGQDHYTEALIRLPNLAIAYPRPEVPPLTRPRSDYGLRTNAVVYLCCQAAFKYLPQHDRLLVEIARQVPTAQFVFIRADSLKPRLGKAFSAAGLEMADYCLFLPVQARHPYLMLNQLSDIYLDTIGFTGGNTTLDALACHLPVVTYPGELMRSRLSYSMLRRMSILETIARSEDEYIEIAVRLGQDADWRNAIQQAIAAKCELLYDDRTCVTALEAFFKQTISNRG
ncbi:MAG: tetratricopeptide repeat protein [Leptolyngbyaceae cyanobacterium bins.59]|nr:tetratricopeptide repeat protein [Leptolyngbyaceae cyanobacterium bins.59]